MNPEKQEGQFFTLNVIGALIIGLILGFLIGAYYIKHENSAEYGEKAAMTDTSSSTDMMNSSNTAAVTDATGQMMSDHMGSNTVSVTNQKAGNAVVLSSITLGSSYWVAIRDNAGEVTNPYILGARRVQAGTIEDLQIALSRNTIGGKKYDVVLYKDNGGDFNFDQSNFVGIATTFSAN